MFKDRVEHRWIETFVTALEYCKVEAGEEVIIARRGEPVARLVPFNPPGQRKFGAMRDRIVVDESFHEPLPEDELKAWEGC